MSVCTVDDPDFAGGEPEFQQPLINTSSVAQLEAFIQMAIRSRRGSAVMGVITGNAGIGKTSAIEYVLEHFPPRAHTDLPACIRIEVRPRSTAKMLAEDWLARFGEVQHGKNTRQYSDEIHEANERNYLLCALLDEANRMNDDCLELVRYIFDNPRHHRPVPVVLVGLPNIWNRIKRSETFESRIGLRWVFEPLPADEILDTVLPKLVIPRWRYSPQDANDRHMGRFVWDNVKPSLRNLQRVLQVAGDLAEDYEEACITLEHIEEAFRLAKGKKVQLSKTEVPEPAEVGQGKHELESELRNAAKAEKRNRKRDE